ncbi:MAG: hypothetical protein OEQ53_01105 [Saprospiraceae bacterium]|nr:hypothetical protein [Saprospiraceae bacterium]
MKIAFLSLFLLITALSCKESLNKENSTRQQQVEQKALEFFATFADRSDWDQFCSFYRTDLEFDDIILQLHLDSLWKFKRFYRWDEEGDRFEKLSPDQEHLTVHSLVVNDSIAVGKGHVNPFYYDGVLLDIDWGMEFTIWLHFDQDLKIMKQIDWFEYDPTVLQSMIERCKENGFEQTPDWLDLSEGNR